METVELYYIGFKRIVESNFTRLTTTAVDKHRFKIHRQTAYEAVTHENIKTNRNIKKV